MVAIICHARIGMAAGTATDNPRARVAFHTLRRLATRLYLPTPLRAYGRVGCAVGGARLCALLSRHLDHVSTDADARHDDGPDERLVYQQMIRLRRSHSRSKDHLLSRMLLVAVSILTVTSSIRADGGTLLWQQRTG